MNKTKSTNDHNCYLQKLYVKNSTHIIMYSATMIESNYHKQTNQKKKKKKVKKKQTIYGSHALNVNYQYIQS